MFRYYRQAGVCYAYLSDVPDTEHPGFEEAFAHARWFKRGWTLQELLAPRDIIFFGKDWSRLGAKADMVDWLSEITGIERGFLRGAELGLASVAKRMSWASERVTTRTEDQAYCLLGIFDVFMSQLYGEGRNAFRRLQEEIMKRTGDQSILAWGYTSSDRKVDFNAPGLFARTPWSFSQSRNIVPYPEWPVTTPWDITARGIRIDAPCITAAGVVDDCDVLMALGAHLEDNDRDILALCLLNIRGDIYQRQFKTPVLVPRDVWMKKNSAVKRVFIRPINLTNRLGVDQNKHAVDIMIVFRFCPLSQSGYSISKTEPADFWDEKNSRLRLKQTVHNAHGKGEWNVVVHLVDASGNERFIIRLQSKAMKTLDFLIQSVQEPKSSSLRFDDKSGDAICQVDNETFDFHSKFREIWCGEITIVVNLDIWSAAQLRDGMIRQIRQAATEIRDTGVLGSNSNPKRLSITRQTTSPMVGLSRTQSGPLGFLRRMSTSKSLSMTIRETETAEKETEREFWRRWIKRGSRTRKAPELENDGSEVGSRSEES
jgi:hypothetical protein